MVIMCGWWCGTIYSGRIDNPSNWNLIRILHFGHNNKVVVESIARPHKGSRDSTMAHLASLCGTGQQMVMVIKVIQKDTLVFFNDKVERPINITTLDEACVPPTQIKPVLCGAHYYSWRNNHDIANCVLIFGRFSDTSISPFLSCPSFLRFLVFFFC
jgi:hypothetical protein